MRRVPGRAVGAGVAVASDQVQCQSDGVRALSLCPLGSIQEYQIGRECCFWELP